MPGNPARILEVIGAVLLLLVIGGILYIFLVEIPSMIIAAGWRWLDRRRVPFRTGRLLGRISALISPPLRRLWRKLRRRDYVP